MGQRRPVAGRLERQHRALRVLLGVVGVAGHEQVAGDAHEAAAERDRVAHLLEQRRRGATGVDGLAEAVRVVELPAVGVEQLGALAHRQPVQVGQHGLVVRERLPVRPRHRGLAPRGGADGGDRLAVAGPGSRGASAARARAAPVPAAPARPPRSAAGAAAPGRLCSIARRASSWRNASRSARTSSTPAASASDSASSAGPSRYAARSMSTWDGTTESWSSASRHSRPRRATRAITASMTLTGTASRGEASASVTKNGLPPVTRCTAVGVGAGPRAQPPHRVGRQRPQRQAHQRRPDEHAEEAAERVSGVDLVVPAGQNQHRAERRDPPGGVAEHVERGVVGPVDVLDDEHGRGLGGELVEQRAEARRRPARCRAPRRAAGPACATPSGRRTRRAAAGRALPHGRRTPGSGWSCRSPPRRSRARRSRGRPRLRSPPATRPRASAPARAAWDGWSHRRCGQSTPSSAAWPSAIVNRFS